MGNRAADCRRSSTGSRCAGGGRAGHGRTREDAADNAADWRPALGASGAALKLLMLVEKEGLMAVA